MLMILTVCFCFWMAIKSSGKEGCSLGSLSKAKERGLLIVNLVNTRN